MRARELDHARTLTEAQDKADSRLQALQFRLYITSNRLRTLEEALSQHVEAAGFCS